MKLDGLLEALDCRVYARAAAAVFGLDRFEEQHWSQMEDALAQVSDVSAYGTD